MIQFLGLLGMVDAAFSTLMSTMQRRWYKERFTSLHSPSTQQDDLLICTHSSRARILLHYTCWRHQALLGCRVEQNVILLPDPFSWRRGGGVSGYETSNQCYWFYTCVNLSILHYTALYILPQWWISQYNIKLGHQWKLHLQSRIKELVQLFKELHPRWMQLPYILLPD